MGKDSFGWDLPLERGVLLKRYKRFLADVRFDDGRVETVHCPNSGSMMGMKEPGSPVVVSDSLNPSRRLRRTLELVQVDDGAGKTWVGVNTMRPNHWAHLAVDSGLVPGLGSVGSLQREVKLGDSRIDLLVTSKRGRRVWVEVKNTTLAAPGGDGVLEAQFPDAVTVRGQKHLRVLGDRVAQGDQAVVLFLVNRADVKRFRAADWVDPDYAQGLREMREQGVRPVALQVGHEVRRSAGRLRVVSGFLGQLPVGRAPACKRVISPQS